MNRLPGPMTMSSASAIACERVRRSAGRPSGVTQTRSTPVGPGDPALADDLGAVVEPRVQRDHGRRSPARPGRAPRARGSSRARPPRSRRARAARSAASSRLPTAWPPSPAGGVSGLERPGSPGRRWTGRGVDGGGAGKRYWSSRPISGSASASATMQLRMSPTAGIPSSVAEHARRAAVVGDRDHGREVAGVLLEPAEQRREAGPAADRDDPRAAGEEPLLVDHLDHRLVAVPGVERVDERADEAVGAVRRTASRRGAPAMMPRSLVRQPLERDRRRRPRPASSPGSGRRPAGAATWATPTARSRSPTNATSSQRLTPMPGVSHRRMFTARARGGRPRHGPEVPLAQPRRELLGDHDRAMEAAGAPDRDREPRLALVDVGRDEQVEDGRGAGRGTVAGDRLAEDVLADVLGQAGARPQRLDVERVLHEPDVEHEVGLERHAVLVAEADQLDREPVGAWTSPRRAKMRSRSSRSDSSLVSSTTSASARTGSSRPRSCGDRGGDPALVRQRVAVAGLREAPDQDLVARLEEDDHGPDPAALERAAHRAERERDVAGAHVEDDRGAREPRGSLASRSARSGSSSPGRLSTTM